jgi:3-deoxy-manno-octulosonate cytidylyltransferase (CMP-KDO synthetase)
MSKTAIIIPARWASSRLPGKPLLELVGKPLVQHVWERCRKVREADEVIIATDDMRIAEAAFAFGADVALTSAKHPTGTDRIAEVAKKLAGFDVILNVQGDEPFIEPALIRCLIEVLKKEKSLAMSTAACPLAEGELENPNCVKVVTGITGDALYFSRSAIPCDRDGDASPARLRHLGIYGYRRKFLLDFVKWKQTPLPKNWNSSEPWSTAQKSVSSPPKPQVRESIPQRMPKMPPSFWLAANANPELLPSPARALAQGGRPVA